jgi:hypothetical protein
MNESQIKDGLRDLVLPEPELGFDPDDVATRAAKRRLTRRASIATGAGTLAVLAVVSALLMTGQGGVAPATMPDDIHTQIERNKRHLASVLPGMIGGARDLKIDGSLMTGERVTENGPGPDLDNMVRLEVSFQGQGGPKDFKVAIRAPHPDPATGALFGLGPACGRPVAGRQSGARVTNVDPRVPQPVEGPKCEKLPQPDGSTVTVTSGKVPAVSRGDADATSISVIHYRKDGVYVGYFAVHLPVGDGPDTTNPLTAEKAIKLVTDPALYLK